MTDLTADLQFLIGERVNGIWFVEDYVEIHFNGSYLRCLENPEILEASGGMLKFPREGSREALCKLIGGAVAAIRAIDGEALSVTFADGRALRVPMAHEGRRGPEALHIHNAETDETQFW